MKKIKLTITIGVVACIVTTFLIMGSVQKTAPQPQQQEPNEEVVSVVEAEQTRPQTIELTINPVLE